MKKIKNLAITLSLGALSTTLPYITSIAQALPVDIDNIKNKEISAPMKILNIENKNTKRNQKEEMIELLVDLYNKYTSILKHGIEINDIKNSSLYFNITKQKTDIKNLLDEIMDYPYNVINSEIEDKFLKSNVIFSYLSNQYLQRNSLKEILNDSENFDEIIKKLENIKNIVTSSTQAIDNYSNVNFQDHILFLNNLLSEIKNSNTENLSFEQIKNFESKLNDIYLNIDSILIDYIHE